jgi:hypothetical protein
MENEANSVEDFAEKHKGSFIAPLYQGPSKSGRTEVWTIVAVEDDFELGQIKWYGPWRMYAWFPEPNTVYESTCLRDIANIRDALNERHKIARSQSR